MSKKYNFILQLIDRFKGDLQIKTGTRLILSGLAIFGGITISAYYENTIFTYDTQSGIVSSFFAGLIIFLGIFLILRRVNELRVNPPYLIYGIGLPNMEVKPPRYALPHNDRSASDLSYPVNSYSRSDVLQAYRAMQYNFSLRVEHQNASKLYIAALGSFPFQFLMGALVRNAHAPTSLLEYDRNESKWQLLKEFCTQQEPIKHLTNGAQLNIQAEVNRILASNPQEVGIALGYTFPIPLLQIPSNISGSTLILEHSYGHGHDKISCKDAQKALLDDLSILLRLLGNGPRKIHIFAAAQSSFCVALGKNYMDNAHGKLVLHNYNNTAQSYDWSIEFDRGNIT